ncbi:MAG TPA: succinate dehydrogenase, cytochrome b556 subunit [Allosphingosinicella sp.]|jgi:succinate dehydrogenase / fumarate reductase cytochrome b subunit|nr:succinate dehydrogenase, cytochrome b556 subunit [Allosphingosinicella sp.]
MSRNPNRPLSPHLTVYKWGPHMLVSILHRITGAGLAIAGAAALVWWLVAAASGEEAYKTFAGWATSWIGIVVAVGLSWAFFQHTLSGLRHLVMDIGAGFEIERNKFWAVMTLAGALLLTAALWLYIVMVRGA